MIDAPVSGGAASARSGVLTVMVGGEVEDLNLARPMIEAYARQITHMGAIGAGQATKACNQVINFGTVACIAEALALARAFGLDTRRLPAALAGGLADSNMLREYARGAETGEKAHMTLLVDSLVGLFCADSRRSGASDRLPMLKKDLGIVTDLARSNGCAVPVITLVDNLFRISSGLQQIKGDSQGSRCSGTRDSSCSGTG